MNFSNFLLFYNIFISNCRILTYLYFFSKYTNSDIFLQKTEKNDTNVKKFDIINLCL